MIPRRLAFAWLLSVSLHAAVVFGIWRSVSVATRPRLVPIVLQDLRIRTSPGPPGAGVAGETPPRRSMPPPPVAMREQPSASIGSTADAARTGAGSPSQVDIGAGLRRDRSLAAFVAMCREGTAPRDSILDPAPSLQEVAVARAMRECNEAAWKLRGLWNRERFAEEFQRNFPNMR